MAKNSFILYHDQKEIIDELDDEQAGKLFKAIYEYNVNKKITLKGALKIIFLPFKTAFDRNDNKWEDVIEKRSKAGKNHTGNQYTRKKELEQMEQVFQNGTNGTVSVSVSDSVSVNDSVSVSVNNIATPTLDSVISFGKDLGVNEDYCKNFFNNYESTGWKIGKNDIKNWKAKFEQWVEDDLRKGNIKIKQEEEYDTRTFFTDEDGRTFKYDSKGGKHYV